MNYYDFALKDLKSAKTMYDYTEEYDVIVVSCQQFVEKALKHLLQITKGTILKTHKLITIYNNINNKKLEDFKVFFYEIQEFYFDKRYPGEDYIETTKEECERIYSETLRFKEVIDSILTDSNSSKMNLF